MRVAVIVVILAGLGCATEPATQLCSTGILCPEGTQCAAVQRVCIVGNCGNGLVDSGEGCDDGNITDGDGCSSSCRIEECGNAELDLGEQCDDGNTADGDGCSPTCLFEICGNGVKDTGEACDDGNLVAGDGCSANCLSAEICGNGTVDVAVGEVCDDGNTANGDVCASDCRSGVGCGNGSIDLDINGDPIEECDDGNTDNADDCRADCIVNQCGDGFRNTAGAVDRREDCDPATPATTGSKLASPLETETCNLDCTTAACGDGKVNAASGEQCDETNAVDTDDCIGNTNPTVGLRCKLNVCGDGVVDNVGPRIEGCDDGNANNSDGCSNSCTTALCGNGILDVGEQCDDGNLSDGDGCLSSSTPGQPGTNCKIAFCGDGKPRAGVEQCDDGNVNNNDDCTNACNLAACGDGFVDGQGGATEVCDDGNAVTEAACPYNIISCTVCRNDCQAALARTGPFCGDGIEQSVNGEACDDGNRVTETQCPYATASCNLCSANCLVDLNGLSGPVCGDGVTDGTAGEACDDRNVSCGTCRADCLAATTAHATGFVFPLASADFVEGNTLRFDDGITPATLFVFTATPTTALHISIAGGVTNLQMRDRIIAAINGIGDQLRITASTTAAGNPTVVLTHDFATTRGNRAIVVSNPAVGVFGMTGGQAGDCAAGQVCGQNDDCQLHDCVLNTCGGPVGLSLGNLAVLGGAKHLYTFASGTTTTPDSGDCGGGCSDMTLSGGATIAASAVPGTQGALSISNVAHRGAIVVDGGWGRTADRTYESVFKMTAAGAGGVLFVGPSTGSLGTSLEFADANNFGGDQLALLSRIGGLLVPLSGGGTGIVATNKLVYLAIVYDNASGNQTVTWKAEGATKQTVVVNDGTGGVSSGSVFFGNLPAGNAAQLAEHYHFAVYDSKLSAADIDARLVVLGIAN